MNNKLDKALSYLNNDKVVNDKFSLNHFKQFSNIYNIDIFSKNYDKLSHKNIKKKPSFHLFHKYIIDEFKKIYNENYFDFKLYGVYNTDEGRLATIVITPKDKNIATTNPEFVEKFSRLQKILSPYKIKSKLKDVSYDTTILDAHYCYTSRYDVYSIDILYKQKGNV